MATWHLSNMIKKSVLEIVLWQKDSKTIYQETVYRLGLSSCQNEERPTIDLENADGIEITHDSAAWEMEYLLDIVEYEWDLADEKLSSAEKQEIKGIVEAEGASGLEKMGWENIKVEQWIHGPLKMVNVDTGQEWEGASQYD